MEQLNRIELRGNVGNVRRQTVGERTVVRFTMATNYAYKDRAGAAVIDTTWHTVVAWSGKGMEDIDKIEKGSKVYVCGRMRTQKYTGADEIERTLYEVSATRVCLIESDDQLQCEFNN